MSLNTVFSKNVMLSSQHINSIKKTQGSALVIAIFVIIVMSLLGAALVNMMDSSQDNVVFEVLGTRAFNAAQSGVQWQLAQLFPLDSASQTCNVIVALPPVIANTAGFKGCEIILTVDSCVNFPHEGIEYYTVKSTGQCSIDGEFTTRTIVVQARSL